MRPLELKIKGLNSFIQEQVVDFEKLTSKGLFGIFGPTGSGKTSILDGITLALYGEIPRKSTNFINMNKDQMQVSFKFRMNKDEIFCVSREFKREKGNIRSKSARIVRFEDDKELILQEGIKNVNTYCQELLGLKIEDFTRTVVLPQGKFSEFLKLNGKERREMLERLFDLSEYGEKLSIELYKKIKFYNEKIQRFLGQLQGFEEIDISFLNKKEENLNYFLKEKIIKQKELQEFEFVYNEQKELFKLQSERNDLILELQEKEKKIKDIEELKIEIEKISKAINLEIFKKNYEETENKFKKFNIEVEKLKINKSEIDEEFEKIKKEKQEIEKIVEENLFNWQEKATKLKEARENKNEILVEEKKQEQREESLLKIQEELKKLLSCRSDKELDLKNLQEKKLKIKEELKNLQIDTDLFMNIEKSLHLENQLDLELKNKQERTKKVNILKENLEKSREDGLNAGSKLKNEEEILNLLVIRLEKLESILDPQKRMIENEDWSIKNQQFEMFKLLDEKFKKINIQINTQKIDVEFLKKELEQNELNLKTLTKKNMDYEIQKSINSIQKIIQKNEICPVCNQKILNEIKVCELKESEEEVSLKEVKEKIESLNKDYFAKEANFNQIISQRQEIEKQLSEISDEIKSLDFEKEKKHQELKKERYEKMQQEQKSLLDQKKELEIKIKKYKEDLDEKRINYKTTKQEIDINNKDLISIDEKIKEMSLELESFKKNFKIEDIKKEHLNIKKKQEKQRSVNLELDKLEENIKKTEDDLKEIQIKVDEKIPKEMKEKTELDERIKYLTEKKNKIARNFDYENIEKQEEENKNKIEFYTQKNKKIREEFEEKNKKAQLVREEKSKKDALLAETETRLKKEEELLKEKLKEENLSIKEFEFYILKKDRLNYKKILVDEFEKEFKKIEVKIQTLNEKLGSNYISDTKWRDTQEKMKSLLQNYEEIKKEIVILDQEVKILKEKIKEKEDILKQKNEVQSQLEIYNDLEKLFKGKKFVEFVALYHLKYVSIEASKKLKNISNSAYGLELDEDGKFLIRDYKNGGSLRDASTLSGGETFLASLALALALSAQIQLKGNTVLEFFFLDEGFGTLDDDLLEVVISSLEKVQNEKLSVGLISHVESIKNRVPIKLIVEPATNIKGSIVKIDVS